MMGVMSLRDAINAAKKLEQDLVEISPNATPPVCKITDFGKFKYEQEKRQHEAKKKQKAVELKEIKLRPNIAIGDFNVKLKSAERFITAGNKVKFSMQFRGREITHPEVGMAIVNKFKEMLEEISKVENMPKMEGRHIYMVLSPKT